MPNGAYHEDLLNVDKFKATALHNAENWYKFAIGTCGREIENGGLRLVTGCDKTNLWGIATYADFRPGTLTLAANDMQPPVEYTWDYEGRVEAKAGPKLDESLNATGSQEYPLHIRNQCTFLRAFTITLAEDAWKTMVSALIQARGSSDNHISNSREPWTLSLTSIVSGSFLGFGNQGGSVNISNHSSRSEKSTIHPATIINQMLLSQYPNAKVAISHDNDWCAVIREDEVTMPDASELLRRVRQTSMPHFDEDGTVYLSQEDAPGAYPQRRSLSLDGFVTTSEYSGRTKGTVSNTTINKDNSDRKLSATGKEPEGPSTTVFSAEGTVSDDENFVRRLEEHTPAQQFSLGSTDSILPIPAAVGTSLSPATTMQTFHAQGEGVGLSNSLPYGLPQTPTNEPTSDDDIDLRRLFPIFVYNGPFRPLEDEPPPYLLKEGFDDTSGDSDFEDDSDFDDDSNFDQDDQGVYLVSKVNEGSDRAACVDHMNTSRESLHESTGMADGKGRSGLAIAIPGVSSYRSYLEDEDSATMLRKWTKSLGDLRSSDTGASPKRTAEFPPLPPASTSVSDSERDFDLRVSLTAVENMDTYGARGGIIGFSQSEMESPTSERRLGAVSYNSHGFFHRTLARNWGGERFKHQQQKWTFQRVDDECLQSRRGERESRTIFSLFSTRSSMSTAPSILGGIFEKHDLKDKSSAEEKAKEQPWNGTAVDAQEWWYSPTNGRYKVMRKNALHVEPGKAPQQRLNIIHRRMPYTNQRDLADGPVVSIHKYSKAVAFSISRHYRLRPMAIQNTTITSLRPSETSRMPNTPTNIDPNQKKTISAILLGPRRVQEAFISTTAKRELESYDESGRTSLRDSEGINWGWEMDTKAKEKRKKKEAEETRNSGSIKSKPRLSKQEFSSESSVAIVRGAVSSGPPPIADPSPASNITSSDASISHLIVTQGTAPSDRTISRTGYRRRVGDDEDDNDLLSGVKSPTRTPHPETYDTIPPDRLEVTSSQEHSLSSLFSWGKQRNSPSSPRAKALIGKSYKRPWAIAPSRHNSDSREVIVDDLNMSFQDVGHRALRGIKGANHSTQKSKREQQSSKFSRLLTSDAAQADILQDIPSDSLYMLLPLWPGETDGKSEQKYPYTIPTISIDDRQYLLIYYKVPFQTPAEQEQPKTKPQTGSKRSPTSSHDPVKNRDDRHVLLTTFHISARVAAYHDLQGSGVRIPDQGLAVQGALADAYGSMPTSIRDEGLVDWVIGICYSRETGIEFLPQSLEKMGLCRRLPTPSASSTRNVGDKESEEEALVLTPIGRAVIEMAWLGGMALTSFGPAM